MNNGPLSPAPFPGERGDAGSLRSKKAYSLRRRLIGGVLALVSAIWLAATLGAWFEARHETEEILDAHLAQAATLLAAFVGHDADELDEHLPEHRYLRKVTFQVWKHGSELGVHSLNAPNHRLSTADQDFADAEFDGGRWRVFSVWNGAYLVQVGETRDARDDIANELASHLLLPLFIALPVLALGLALLIGRGLRPLSTLADNIARRDAQRLDPIDVAEAPQELQPVLGRLNELFDRLGRSLEQERRFTADAAHELRTPLAAVRTHAQVAMGATSGEEQQAALTHVIEATDRATYLLEQLLTLARLDAVAMTGPPGSLPPTGRVHFALGRPGGEIYRAFAPCDLQQLAATAVALAAPAAMARDIDLALADGPAIAVKGDAALLGVLLRNLIDNAVRYSPPKVGTPRVHSRKGICFAAPSGRVGVTAGIASDGQPFIAVCDQGPGIPLAERGRVLDRFYRIAGSDETGSGLGLSIAARIAELHGAQLELNEGADGKGLKVRVVFPASISD